MEVTFATVSLRSAVGLEEGTGTYVRRKRSRYTQENTVPAISPSWRLQRLPGRTQALAHKFREKNSPLGYFKIWISCIFDFII